MADLLPSRPLLSSPREEWSGPTLDLFEHPPAEVHVPGPSGRLARVVDFMKAHLDEPIGLAQMSGVVGLSQTQFARAFRQAAGLAPRAYLIDLRMQEARRLLEQTRQPVTAIALACGFEQPGHFATMFRRKTGFTPRSWRLLRAS